MDNANYSSHEPHARLAAGATRIFEGRTALVTGGAGFVGSHLVEGLVEAGARVAVVDDLRTGYAANLDSLKTQVQAQYTSVEKACSLAAPPWERLDFIFHLANESYVPPSLDDPFSDLNNNVLPTLTILEMARRRYPRAAIVYTSSAAVYGEPAKLPMAENDDLVPISPYGVSKLAAEQYISLYTRLYGLRTVILRLFSTFGPRQRKQVVYDFFRKLAADPRKLEVIGDGTQTRDMIYVKDVVRAVLTIAARGKWTAEAYNVASGQSLTVRELALRIAYILELSPAMKFTGSSRPGDPIGWLADVSKIRALGFQPAYSLDAGLIAVRDWMSSLDRGEIQAPRRSAG